MEVGHVAVPTDDEEGALVEPRLLCDGHIGGHEGAVNVDAPRAVGRVPRDGAGRVQLGAVPRGGVDGAAAGRRRTGGGGVKFTPAFVTPDSIRGPASSSLSRGEKAGCRIKSGMTCVGQVGV